MNSWSAESAGLKSPFSSKKFPAMASNGQSPSLNHTILKNRADTSRSADRSLKNTIRPFPEFLNEKNPRSSTMVDAFSIQLKDLQQEISGNVNWKLHNKRQLLKQIRKLIKKKSVERKGKKEFGRWCRRSVCRRSVCRRSAEIRCCSAPPLVWFPKYYNYTSSGVISMDSLIEA